MKLSWCSAGTDGKRTVLWPHSTNPLATRLNRRGAAAAAPRPACQCRARSSAAGRSARPALRAELPARRPCGSGSGPDASLGHLVDHVREIVEVPLLSREATARDVEGQVVGPEERLQRVHARARVAEVPDGCSGNGGVISGGPAPAIAGSSVGTKSGCQIGSAVVAGFRSRSACWIAEIGRQEPQWYCRSSS